MENITRYVANSQCKTDNINILQGNIIPNDWYQKFTNSRGTPDLSLISVLSEIVYWYRPTKSKDPNTGDIIYINKFLGDAWQTSYEHFEKKFGFNREKLRRIFVKLEQMGICARQFRNVKLRGQTYNNRLFIHLSSEFLNSCTIKKNKSINSSISFFDSENEGGSPHFDGDHIIDIKNKNNIIKNRSSGSNFCKNSFEEKVQKVFELKIEESRNQLGLNVPQEVDKSKDESKQIKNIFIKSKELKDFYPLSDEDCRILQASSRSLLLPISLLHKY